MGRGRGGRAGSRRARCRRRRGPDRQCPGPLPAGPARPARRPGTSRGRWRRGLRAAPHPVGSNPGTRSRRSSTAHVQLGPRRRGARRLTVRTNSDARGRRPGRRHPAPLAPRTQQGLTDRVPRQPRSPATSWSTPRPTSSTGAVRSRPTPGVMDLDAIEGTRGCPPPRPSGSVSPSGSSSSSSAATRADRAIARRIRSTPPSTPPEARTLHATGARAGSLGHLVQIRAATCRRCWPGVPDGDGPRPGERQGGVRHAAAGCSCRTC